MNLWCARGKCFLTSHVLIQIFNLSFTEILWIEAGAGNSSCLTPPAWIRQWQQLIVIKKIKFPAPGIDLRCLPGTSPDFQRWYTDYSKRRFWSTPIETKHSSETEKRNEIPENNKAWPSGVGWNEPNDGAFVGFYDRKLNELRAEGRLPNV